MDRQEQYKRAIKTFTYLDGSLDEKSLLLGMNWADEFPEFKFEEFIEKTVNWMKSIVTKEGNSEERVITDKMIKEYLKVVKDTY